MESSPCVSRPAGANHTHPAAAPRAHRAPGATDPATARPSGALPRHPRAGSQPAREGRASTRSRADASRSASTEPTWRAHRHGSARDTERCRAPERRRGAAPCDRAPHTLGGLAPARVLNRCTHLPALRLDVATDCGDRGSRGRSRHPRVDGPAGPRPACAAGFARAPGRIDRLPRGGTRSRLRPDLALRRRLIAANAPHRVLAARSRKGTCASSLGLLQPSSAVTACRTGGPP